MLKPTHPEDSGGKTVVTTYALEINYQGNIISMYGNMYSSLGQRLPNC